MAVFYDLFVLLDPETPEERRTAVVEQVKSQLGSGGAALKGDADWGMRRLSYEIDHRREAQYHLFQFEGTPDVLTRLDRSLSIDDAVLRHRIIRLPGEAPDTTPGPTEEAPRRSSDDRPPRDDARERPGDEADAAAVTSPEAPAPPPAVAEPAESVPAEPAAEGVPAEQVADSAPAEQVADGAPAEAAPVAEVAPTEGEPAPDETA